MGKYQKAEAIFCEQRDWLKMCEILIEEAQLRKIRTS